MYEVLPPLHCTSWRRKNAGTDVRDRPAVAMNFPSLFYAFASRTLQTRRCPSRSDVTSISFTKRRSCTMMQEKSNGFILFKPWCGANCSSWSRWQPA